MAAAPDIITPEMLPPQTEAGRLAAGWLENALWAVVSNTAANAQATRQLAQQLGVTTPAGRAVTRVLPITFNLQDFVDAAVAAGVSNLAPPQAAGLAISVPPGATFTLVNQPQQVNGQPQVWVLGNDVSVSTDTTSPLLTLTITVDGVHNVFPSFPLLRTLYTSRLSRFIAVRQNILFLIVNGTTTTVTVNTVVEYVTMDRTLYDEVLAAIMADNYMTMESYGRELRKTAG
jgi:hypothetical protein